jgi:hypothetical protein
MTGLPSGVRHVPRHRDAVAAHVRQHAAALLGGIPEPALVRPGVLFGAAGEGISGPIAALLRRQLRICAVLMPFMWIWFSK